DAVALRDPHRRERRSQRVGPLFQIAVRQLRAQKMRRDPIGPMDRGDREDVAEWPGWIRHVRPDPVVVVLLPRSRGVAGFVLHAIVRPPSTTIVWPVM